jgi:hypothetical protein
MGIPFENGPRHERGTALIKLLLLKFANDFDDILHKPPQDLKPSLGIKQEKAFSGNDIDVLTFCPR